MALLVIWHLCLELRSENPRGYFFAVGAEISIDFLEHGSSVDCCRYGRFLHRGGRGFPDGCCRYNCKPVEGGLEDFCRLAFSDAVYALATFTDMGCQLDKVGIA